MKLENRFAHANAFPMTASLLLWSSMLLSDLSAKGYSARGWLPIAGAPFSSWVSRSAEAVDELGKLNFHFITLAFIGLIAIFGFGLLRRQSLNGATQRKAGPVIQVGGNGAQAGSGGPDYLAELLSRARFPMKRRCDLVAALGGSRATVRIHDSLCLPAEEVADRCFSQSRIFKSPRDILDAFSRSSWASAVLASTNMIPFPINSQEDLGRIKDGYVEGIQISELVQHLNFPIRTPSELLSQLSRARFNGEGPLAPVSNARNGEAQPAWA